MAMAISSLTSSLTSLTLSSKPHSRPRSVSFPFAARGRRFAVLACAAAAEAEAAEEAVGVDEESPAKILADAAEAAARITPTIPNLPLGMTVEKYMRSRLPGGIAAQKIIATGRRKCAIARVVLMEGDGKVIVNYRDAKDYFHGTPQYLKSITTPLIALGLEKQYDIFVKTHGGGLSGQSQAICLGVARALVKITEENRVPLRQEGLLTRDARVVERKKPGLRKARKRPQYSKR